MISMAPMPAPVSIGHPTGGAVAALVAVLVAWAVVYGILRWTLDESRVRTPVRPHELLNRVKYPDATGAAAAPDRAGRQTDDSSS